MDKDNKYYTIIENLVKSHKKFAGCEVILSEIIDDVYSHAKIILESINDDAVLTSFLEKLVSTSLVTVPKKLNFNPTVPHKIISSTPANIQKIQTDAVKVKNDYVDMMINGYSSATEYENHKKQVKQSISENIQQGNEDIVEQFEQTAINQDITSDNEFMLNTQAEENIDVREDNNSDEITDINNFNEKASEEFQITNEILENTDEELNETFSDNLELQTETKEIFDNSNDANSINNETDTNNDNNLETIEDSGYDENVNNEETIEDSGYDESQNDDEKIEQITTNTNSDTDIEMLNLNDDFQTESEIDIESSEEFDTIDFAEEQDDNNDKFDVDNIQEDTEQSISIDENISIDIDKTETEDSYNTKVLYKDSEIEDLNNFEIEENPENSQKITTELDSDTDNSDFNVDSTEDNDDFISINDETSNENQLNEDNMLEFGQDDSLDYNLDANDELAVQSKFIEDDINSDINDSGLDATNNFETIEIDLPETQDNIIDSVDDNVNDIEVHNENSIDEFENIISDDISDNTDIIDNIDTSVIDNNDFQIEEELLDIDESYEESSDIPDYSIFKELYQEPSSYNVNDILEKIKQVAKENPDDEIMEIVNLYYKEHLTLNDIASKLSISVDNVSEILKKIVLAI